jgi:O-antigen/teichoic acid export membrane protein
MTVALGSSFTKPKLGSRLGFLMISPALAMFISSNVANAGNLVFNMLFSRWMGPDLFGDLATLLTLKLSLLALLNAVQMAVSQVVAVSERGSLERGLALLNRVGFVLIALALPVLVPSALTGALGAALGIESAPALVVLLLVLPVTVPLCLYRGVATGRMDIGQIIFSANLEMAVRLGGAITAWKLGFGIEGVTLAIAASLVAGWLPVSRALSGKTVHDVAAAPIMRNVAKIALPFAVLQAAQVAHLDGDVLVANAALDQAEIGLVAVLSLFQRIQFFACFGLAAVLLPSVTAAVAQGRNGLRESAPVAGLFLAVSLPLLAVLYAAPVTVIRLLAGPDFVNAAAVLPLAGLCAMFFTLSYLCATYLAALNNRRGIWVVAAFVPVQLGSYALQAHLGMDLGQMMIIKTLCQAGLSASLIVLILWKARAQRVVEQNA